MVRVVSRVRYGNVLEQYDICSEDLIHPGPGLSSIPPHAACATVLQQRLMPWEGVRDHVH